MIEEGANQELKNAGDFLASRGLDGDRSLAGSALVSANTLDEYAHGLKLVSNCHPRGITKEFFIKIGLKMKKMNAEEWNSRNIQKEFTELLHNWEPVVANTTNQEVIIANSTSINDENNAVPCSPTEKSLLLANSMQAE